MIFERKKRFAFLSLPRKIVFVNTRQIRDLSIHLMENMFTQRALLIQPNRIRVHPSQFRELDLKFFHVVCVCAKLTSLSTRWRVVFCYYHLRNCL